MYDNSRMRRDVGRYIQHLRDSNLSRGYVLQVEGLLGKFLEYCRGRGVRSVKGVSVDEIRDFMGQYNTMSAGYQRFTYTRLRGFLAHWQNPSVLTFKLRVRGTGRTRVDWLSPEETEKVMETPMTPREAVLITGGLTEGLRQIELLRMTVRDAQRALAEKRIRVKGKGGKERPVPLQEDFAYALRAYLQTTDKAQEDLLLGIKETQTYRTLREFCERHGRRITHHTLRRSFGRNLWLKGIPIETIAELMGHASTDMTRLYLGLNITDMEKAMSCYKLARHCTIISRPVP